MACLPRPARRGRCQLAMLLTNSRSIREVVLFPLLRPEGEIGLAAQLRAADCK